MKLQRTAIALALLVVFLFFPGKAVQFVSAFTLLAGLFSWAYCRILESGFTATRSIHELRVARFDRLELSVTITNNSFLPVASCFLADASGELSISAEDGRWLFAIGAHEMRTVRYTIVGNHRGLYTVGPLQIASSDPLGLFPFKKVIKDTCTVLVRPARVDTALAFNSGIPQGSVSVHDTRFEDVTLYRSVRDYVAGDELKRINWKSSARFGRLFTNEYQDSLNCPVFVYLSLSANDYPLHLRHSLAESAIEVAAALIERASLMKQQCGFASSGIAPGSTDKPFIRVGASQSECILDILARISMSDAEDSGELLARALYTIPSGSRFFRIGPAAPESGSESDSASGCVSGSVCGIPFRQISEYVHEAII